MAIMMALALGDCRAERKHEMRSPVKTRRSPKEAQPAPDRKRIAANEAGEAAARLKSRK